MSLLSNLRSLLGNREPKRYAMSMDQARSTWRQSCTDLENIYHELQAKKPTTDGPPVLSPAERKQLGARFFEAVRLHEDLTWRLTSTFSRYLQEDDPDKLK